MCNCHKYIYSGNRSSPIGSSPKSSSRFLAAEVRGRAASGPNGSE